VNQIFKNVQSTDTKHNLNLKKNTKGNLQLKKSDQIKISHTVSNFVFKEQECKVYRMENKLKYNQT